MPPRHTFPCHVIQCITILCPSYPQDTRCAHELPYIKHSMYGHGRYHMTHGLDHTFQCDIIKCMTILWPCHPQCASCARTLLDIEHSMYGHGHDHMTHGPHHDGKLCMYVCMDPYGGLLNLTEWQRITSEWPVSKPRKEELASVSPKPIPTPKLN